MIQYGISLLLSLSILITDKNPIELGKIDWHRDYDSALLKSEKTDKPVFILFQEVPGCSTCRNYGKDVLSHPFIVEAIEDNFVPLVIHNNKKGKDAEVLKKYKEPSWNNPVARIVNAEGKMIANRIAGNYSKLGVIDAMIQAQTKEGKAIPTYLSLFREELIAEANLSEISLSMFCFWSGEKELGAIQGVVSTEAGYMDGREVVKVRYNDKTIDAKSIIKKAASKNCADAVYINEGSKEQFAFKHIPVRDYKSYRSDKETKYYLYKSPLKQIPMTELQALKVNRALATGGAPEDYLSPRQIEMANQLRSGAHKKSRNRISDDFVKSWNEVTSLQGK